MSAIPDDFDATQGPLPPLGSIIESLGVYLPPKSVSTAEVVAACENPIPFPLEAMTGIKTRRMAGESEFSIDLARKALAECLARSRYGAGDIDLLVCCNISRCDGPGAHFAHEPSTSARLCHEGGFRNALAFDISNACAGLFTGIYVIDSFIRAGLIRRGVAVSGEHITHLTRTAQKEIAGFLDPRMACLTVGDAGAAVLIDRSPNDRVGLHEIAVYTQGKYGNHCIARATDRPHGGAIMLTDSINLAAVAIKQGAMHAARTLRDHGWLDGRVDHLIMHQTSESALKGALRELNGVLGATYFDAENTVFNVAERGNTASTSHFVALHDQILSGRIESGDRVVFGISASGQTTGTALYTLDDLPDRIRAGRAAASAPTPAPSAPAERAVCAPRALVRIESLGSAGSAVAPRDTLELVEAAAEDCFLRSAHDRGAVDLIEFSGVYRSEYLSEPAVAALAAGRLRINETVESPESPRTLAFDVGSGGVGFLSACHIAARLIQAGRHRVALVSAAEVDVNRGLPGIEPLGVIETGSAVILDECPEGKSGFVRFGFRSFGEHVDRLESHTAMVDGRLALLVKRDPAWESFALRAIAETVDDLLGEEGLTIADIRVVLPPQCSGRFVSGLAEVLGVPRESCIDATSPAGDYFTSSLVQALRLALDEGKARSGELGLMIEVGSGLQVGCALYRF